MSGVEVGRWWDYFVVEAPGQSQRQGRRTCGVERFCGMLEMDGRQLDRRDEMFC